jgi:exodeoxyribonuclease VII small subunit
VTAADGGERDAQAQAKRPPYEQARDELAELVKRLEAGGLTLEQSLQLWERGERLAAVCTEWLEGARARLAEAMARRANGSDPAAPF